MERALEGDCLLYTSDAAAEPASVDLGGRRSLKKKTNKINTISPVVIHITKDTIIH